MNLEGIMVSEIGQSKRQALLRFCLHEVPTKKSNSYRQKMGWQGELLINEVLILQDEKFWSWTLIMVAQKCECT
jgi:hypothetical protein